MAHQKIYIVDNIGEMPPRAVFDSKEKAQQYTTRFKTNRNYEIFEQDLNPHFEADPKKMPMEIEFGSDDEIHISEAGRDEREIGLAMANRYELANGSLYCYTLAKDEGEAMINAMKIRDRAVEEGNWK